MEKEGLWLWRNHKQGIQLNFSGSGSESLDYVAVMLIVAWFNISLGIRLFLISKVCHSEVVVVVGRKAFLFLIYMKA